MTRLLGKTPINKLWNSLVDKCTIERNRSNDVIFSLSNFKYPVKELLYQNYLFNEQGEDIYFMEVTLKTAKNYVTNIDQVMAPIRQKDMNNYIINLRAYSVTRNIWIKDHQPLKSLISALQRERYISRNTFLIYYSMIRDACVLLAYRVKFSDNAKTKEVKKIGRIDVTDLLGKQIYTPLNIYYCRSCQT